MTWAQDAAAQIAALHAQFPADMSLKDRKAALTDGAWQFHGGTSWGKKVWAKAKREYLERHGQRHGHGVKEAPAPLFDQAPASPLKWEDEPDQGYTTAYLGAVLVGRIFYAEKRTRYFCSLKVSGHGMTIVEAVKNRATAETIILNEVLHWIEAAGLRVVRK